MSVDAATRHGFLELRGERGFLEEGYDFLDEKRLLLAQRILSEHRAYRNFTDALLEAWNAAVDALGMALRVGGAHALAVADAPRAAATLQPLVLKSHLGVPQLQFAPGEPPTATPPEHPADDYRRCAEALARVIEIGQLLAASTGNLERLVEEYRRTDRRARALENVVLPEIDARLARMAAVLDDLDLEEVTRTRLAVPG